MSAASSATPPRRPNLPVFLGGRRPPGHTLVSITSLRGLHRLLLLSLLGQVVIIGLLLGASGSVERRLLILRDPAARALLRGKG